LLGESKIRIPKFPFAGRCNIAECDSPESSYYAPHTEWSIPRNGKDLDACNRYSNSELPNWNQSVDICSADHFTRISEACPDNQFVFRDNEVTISNDVSIKGPPPLGVLLSGTTTTACQTLRSCAGRRWTLLISQPTNAFTA